MQVSKVAKLGLMLFHEAVYAADEQDHTEFFIHEVCRLTPRGGYLHRSQIVSQRLSQCDARLFSLGQIRQLRWRDNSESRWRGDHPPEG